MDCLFNLFIPKSTTKTFILRPTSKTFINGLSKSYEEKYFPELSHYIEEAKFIECLQRINRNLNMMWPCCFCFSFGYFACPATAGLSFLCPWLCINDAQEQFINDIHNINETILNKRGLLMRYKSICITSWIEIEILEYEKVDATSNELIELKNDKK